MYGLYMIHGVTAAMPVAFWFVMNWTSGGNEFKPGVSSWRAFLVSIAWLYAVTVLLFDVVGPHLGTAGVLPILGLFAVLGTPLCILASLAYSRRAKRRIFTIWRESGRLPNGGPSERVMHEYAREHPELET